VDRLVRIDPDTGKLAGVIRTDRNPGGVAVEEGTVWVTNSGIRSPGLIWAGTGWIEPFPLVRIRPGGSRKRYGGGRRPDLGPRHRRHHHIRLGAPVAARTISVGRNITGIVVGAGSVWVTVDAP